MIFYFSGTGNSLHVAREISNYLGDKLIFIPDETSRSETTLNYDIKDGDYLGFVFPVHAWGPPMIVLEFINRLDLAGHIPYVFSVVTCGEEEGKTTDILRRSLEKKSLPLSSAFTLVMPNSYILSYDVESEEVIYSKLLSADEKIKDICKILENREVNRYQIISGSFTYPKSKVINNFFRKYALDNKHFNVDENCNGCGLCEEICPVHSIHVNGKPHWKGACTMCLACLNRCPTHAIQYDKKTVNKGRYVHPDIR